MTKFIKNLILSLLLSIGFFAGLINIVNAQATGYTYTTNSLPSTVYSSMTECTAAAAKVKGATACTPYGGGWGLLSGTSVDTTVSSLYPDQASCQTAYLGKSCTYFSSKGAYITAATNIANSGGSNIPATPLSTSSTTGTTPSDGAGWAYESVVGSSLSTLFSSKAECEASKSWVNTNACVQYNSYADYKLNGGTIDDSTLKGLECNIITGPWDGCVPIVIYYGLYKPAAEFLIVSAKAFDLSLTLSIDQQYVNQPFVTSAWEIVRDFANMLFIFVLLYVGINTMLGGAGHTRAIFMVIIVALLINFSLFFTKIIIDAGNILAVGVYESIGSAPAPGQPRDISLSLSNAFHPQQFALFESKYNLDSVDRTVIFLVATVVNVLAGWIFITVALLFVGRLLAFWFLMIVSPAAFISTILPKGNQFNKWFTELTNQAMVAPLFLFMLYLIMQFVTAGGGIFTSIDTSYSTPSQAAYNILVIPILKAMLIIYALFKARDFAKSLSGEFGKAASSTMIKTFGIGAGVALGGAGIAGRVVARTGAIAGQKTLGRLGSDLVKDEGFKSFAGKYEKWGGRALFAGAEKMATGNYDVRSAPGVNKISGWANKGLSKIKVDPYVGLGKGTDTSYEKSFKEYKESDEAFAKKVMYDAKGKLMPDVAKSIKESLEKGYLLRTATGGNVAAKKASESIGAKIETYQKAEKAVESKETREANKLRELEEKQNAIFEKYAESLKKSTDDTRSIGDIPSKELESLKNEHQKKLEEAVDKAKAELDVAPQPKSKDDIDNINARKAAVQQDLKAQRELASFEKARVELEKTQKALKELRELAQEKKDEKTIKDASDK